MKKSQEKRTSKPVSKDLARLAQENRDYSRSSNAPRSNKERRPAGDPGSRKARQNEVPESLYYQQKADRDARHSAMDPRQERIPASSRDSESGKKKKNRNQTFAGITYLFVTLFICLMGYIVYFNVYRAQTIVNSPYNPRTNLLADQYIRGSILASDGTILAETVQTEEGDTYRRYPHGSVYAHVVGYDSNGKSGIESTSNFSLLNSHAFFPEKIANEFKGQKNMGDTVVTTLDPRLQEAAWSAMGDNRGAVVAIEPSTGRIRAMVSKPDFDPNDIENNWETYNSDDTASVLLNRASQGSYPPGSTFKILTTLEYTREYSDYADYTYSCSGSITQGDTTIQCYNGTVHGDETLETAFAYSCNAAFSNIGMMLDGTKFRETCESLMFNNQLPGPVKTVQTQFTLDGSSGYATKMMTAMGQGETLTNPYQMAMIVAAVANGGTLMEPYLVEQVQNYTGTVVSKNSPHTYKKLMTARESQILTELMASVVTQGTATELYNGDYSVAGKTGTAEYSDDKSLAHSWFVGFSNIDNPDLVVAVIMEGYDGNSSARSLPVAKAVFDAYYYQ